jgi:hypothetical protein
MPSQSDPLQRLETLAGKAPRRAADVRALARFAATSECRLAAVGFAARVDFDRLLEGTRFEAPFGQSPFAFRRGNRFEGRLRANAYAPMLGLLQAHLGHGIRDARVANLREGFEKSYRGMAARAKQSESAISTKAQRCDERLCTGAKPLSKRKSAYGQSPRCPRTLTEAARSTPRCGHPAG